MYQQIFTKITKRVLRKSGRLRAVLCNGFFIINFCILPLLAASAAEMPAKSTKKKDDINSKTPIKITSDEMKSYKKKNFVSFIGHVIAYKDDMTIHADQIDVYSDKTQKELEQIVAIGNVKIKKEDMEGTCEKGIYEEYEKKVTLIGNAIVIKKDNVIKGSKIVYLLEEESVMAYSDTNKKVEVTLFPDQLKTEKNKPN